MSALMQMVDGADVAELISIEDSLVAAREAAVAAAGGRLVTGRMQIEWNGDDSGTRILAAAMPDLDLFGYKQFHWVGQGVRYACHLFRASDGAPLGIVDAAALTTLRSAATAAVGVERLYGSGREAVVAVIGSGAEAAAGLRALSAVVDIREARVTSRRTENRERFATAMSEAIDVPVRTFESLRAATAGADIVYAATASGGSVVFGPEDLTDVQVLATIGSTAPDQREASGAVFLGASTVVIDTHDALLESGDLIEARELGFETGSATLLGALLEEKERAPGLPGTAIFKSIGSPEQDLVLARYVLERADQAGRGRRVQPAMSLKANL